MTAALIILVLVFIVLALYAVVTYNRLVSLAVSADEGESEIDVQLRRRHDLIPNLVETVKGYAAHERETLGEVVRARGAAVNAGGTAGRAEAESGLTQALGKLLALAESYPDLKANENFLELQRELTATEDRIQAARRFYNDTTQALNTKIRTFPPNIIAGMFQFREREFFELEERSQSAVPSAAF